MSLRERCVFRVRSSPSVCNHYSAGWGWEGGSVSVNTAEIPPLEQKGKKGKKEKKKKAILGCDFVSVQPSVK